MIKNRYVLSQEQCCQAQGNFAIHQRHQERQEQHESGFSEFNFAPQDNVGRFQQRESMLFCCSCKNIKRLSLQLYGQQLSLAESYGNVCCLGNACSGDLVVYSHSKVILGTIRKTCSAWCSQNVLLIQDENHKEIFSLRMQCCQWGNFCPRFLRCSRAIQYEVIDCRGERAGVIRNVSRSWFAMQDDFQLQFLSVEKEKEKILLLNAVVYLNLMRHECL